MSIAHMTAVRGCLQDRDESSIHRVVPSGTFLKIDFNILVGQSLSTENQSGSLDERTEEMAEES